MIEAFLALTLAPGPSGVRPTLFTPIQSDSRYPPSKGEESRRRVGPRLLEEVWAVQCSILPPARLGYGARV
ncbi:hypothetical protein GCM10027090_25150 [Sinomonas soli]